MSLTRLVVGIVSVGPVIFGPGTTFGQEYPNKPIRIVTAGVGGGADFNSRVIAQELAAPLRQPVVIDNRSGVIPAEVVAKSPPDGYTLLLSGGNLWIGPLLQNLSYDPVRDFAPVSLVTTSPNIIVVHPSLPVKSVKELIALAKARPGEINYSSSGAAGGAAHLAVELFNSMAGVKFVRIPYKNDAMEAADLIAGHVQLTFGTAASVTPHVKSGKLKALAVTSVKPSALFPELPTVATSGVPGYESGVSFGIFAPAKTSATIINRLNQEIVRVLNLADVRGKFLNVGLETFGTSPEQLASTVKGEMAKWDKVIKDIGIKVN